MVNAGGELTISGDRIRYRLPKDYPEKERILAELREYKPEIIWLLSARPRTCAPSCYEIERGRWIHRPWNRCTTGKVETDEPQRKVAVACWHCRGEKRCACIACWQAGPGDCVTCKGSGQVWQWVQ